MDSTRHREGLTGPMLISMLMLAPRISRRLRLALALVPVLFGARLPAQMSFSSAVTLALSSSPRVHQAQDDVDKARAALAQTRDAYIPSVSGVMDLGYSYGAPLGQPTLFSFATQSLAFNYSQRDYIRAAQSGLIAANLTLTDTRQQVAEDAAITYVSLDHAQQRRNALAEELGYANRLADIVQERIDGGQDSQIELLRARRTAAQLRLQMLQIDDELDGYRDHLNRLDGLPSGQLMTVSNSIPPLPNFVASTPGQLPDAPALGAAMANARAKQEQARGDSRYRFRPQIGFSAKYSRFSTFNNYATYYPAFANNTLNAIGIGIEISIPFYDRGHQDHAAETLADARHAEDEVNIVRDQLNESRVKLQHSGSELAVRAEVASLDQQIAQQQLNTILLELQNGTGNSAGPQLSPKDEQNAHIEERQHFLEFLDATSQLREIQIRLLRQDGELDDWLKSAIAPHP